MINTTKRFWPESKTVLTFVSVNPYQTPCKDKSLYLVSILPLPWKLINEISIYSWLNEKQLEHWNSKQRKFLLRRTTENFVESNGLRIE